MLSLKSSFALLGLFTTVLAQDVPNPNGWDPTTYVYYYPNCPPSLRSGYITLTVADGWFLKSVNSPNQLEGGPGTKFELFRTTPEGYFDFDLYQGEERNTPARKCSVGRPNPGAVERCDYYTVGAEVKVDSGDGKYINCGPD